MKPVEPAQWTAFAGPKRIASGQPEEVAVAVWRRVGDEPGQPVLVFDRADGRLVDLDLRGAQAEVAARYAPRAEAPEPTPRERGRPKLGVTAREVTLLPRHWAWLSEQPSGASAALRRLVEAAIRAGGEPERLRQAREAAYRFMSAVAGDLPMFEEASRALFAQEPRPLREIIAPWPPDVRDEVLRYVADVIEPEGPRP